MTLFRSFFSVDELLQNVVIIIIIIPTTVTVGDYQCDVHSKPVIMSPGVVSSIILYMIARPVLTLLKYGHFLFFTQHNNNMGIRL